MHECVYHGFFLTLQCTSFTPECDEHLKPKVGMTFEGLEAVEKFYKAYAHLSGFGVRIGQQEKYEAFIGSNIPTEVNIHPPTDVRTVGRCGRIKSGKEIKEDDRKKKDKEAKEKAACLCKTCKQMVFHDSHNCPSKTTQGKRSMIVEDVEPNGAF